MSTPLFEIQNLKVAVGGKLVIKGISLKQMPGEVHALMGLNGSGKTTLSNAIMGNPKYKIREGKILLNGEDISDWSPEKRAKNRIFLAFQNPVGIPGVTVANFLRSAIRAVRGDEVPSKEVRKLIKKEIAALEIPESFMTRSLNDSFSGGEKKRLETLQLHLLQPKVAILDETDSGLDIDALKLVAERINSFRDKDRTLLLITHYQRMLNYIKPDFVHVLIDGKIVKSGGPEIAEQLEAEGYAGFTPGHKLSSRTEGEGSQLSNKKEAASG